jgi:hypothetical protein
MSERESLFAFPRHIAVGYWRWLVSDSFLRRFLAVWAVTLPVALLITWKVSG